MYKSNDIFDLIKSLSKSEKRYVSLNMSFHKGEKQYLKVFEVMDKMNRYDEKLLKKKIGDSEINKKIHVIKNYLYKAILKSLRSYHADISTDVRLRNRLHDIEILISRGLLEQAKKGCQQTKKIAYEHESFKILDEILALEQHIFSISSYVDINEADIDDNYNQSINTLNMAVNQAYFRNLSSKFFFIHHRVGSRKKSEDMKKFELIYSDPLLADVKNALTTNAKLIYYNIKSTYCAISGNFEESYQYEKEVLTFFKSKHFKKDDHYRYIVLLANFLTTALGTKRYVEFIQGLQEMQALLNNAIIISQPQTYIYLFCVFYRAKITFCMRTGLVEKTDVLIKEISQGLNEYAGKIIPIYKVFFHCIIGYIYFLRAEYDKALYWANNILNDTDIKTLRDFSLFSKILILIIYFELKNNQLLESNIRSLYRYLLLKDKPYAFEKIILDFIKKQSFKKISRKDQVKVFINLKIELGKISDDPLKKEIMEDFGLQYWLDSKIENLSTADIIKRNVDPKIYLELSQIKFNI